MSLYTNVGLSCKRTTNSVGFVQLSQKTVMQNFIELSAAVSELSCIQRKNLDENNTVRH